MEQSSSFSAEGFAQAPSYPAPKKRGKRIFAILFILILLLISGFIGAGRFLGMSNISQLGNPTPTPTEEITPTEEPTPTEEVTPTPDVSKTPTPKPTANPIDKTTGLDRSKLSIEVQNGSGEVGAASKISDFLKSLGYRVSSIGNASNFNFEDMTIAVKNDSSNYLSLLKADLGKQYTISSSSATLSASSSADAQVIVGK